MLSGGAGTSESGFGGLPSDKPPEERLYFSAPITSMDGTLGSVGCLARKILFKLQQVFRDILERALDAAGPISSCFMFLSNDSVWSLVATCPLF